MSELQFLQPQVRPGTKQ